MLFPGPTALILGVNRSGSTSVFELLRQHPDACVSRPKESYYFDNCTEYQMGLDFYRQTYFKGYTGQAVAVDANPRLMMLPWAIPRVRATCPGARFVVVLRDPVARAFSQWALRGIVNLDARGFAACIAQNLARWNSVGNVFDKPGTEHLWRQVCWKQSEGRPNFVNYDYFLESGLYAINLARWFAVFPRSQFLILTNDQLGQPGMVVTIYNHVGLDPSRGLAAVPNVNSWRRYVGQNNAAQASGMVPDAATVATLKTFYAPQDAALCTLLGWKQTPWSITPDNFA